jgi:hypothetical protein
MSLLWFRRSRKGDSKAPQATSSQQTSETTPRQQRAPLRIRGLLLLNLQPTDGTEQIEGAPPLGSRDHVVRSVVAAAPGIRFDDSGRGEVRGADHYIAIDLGKHDLVHAAVASAEGDIGVEALRTLLQREGWRAYAPRVGVFIEPDALDLFALPDAPPPPGRV